MQILLFVISCLLLMLGHFLKTLRQKQFADIYEKVNTGVFLNALAAGYIVNFILPFRLGDILRAYLGGRKMKNGFSFSLATVIVDRFFDVIMVGLIYAVMYFGFIGKDPAAEQSARFYGIFAMALIILAFMAINMKGMIKKVIRLSCSLFNDRIELSLMFFFWALITAFRDIAVKINKLRLVLLTLGMWASYMASYYVLAVFLSSGGNSFSMYDIFSMLFSRGSIDSGSVKQVIGIGSMTFEMSYVIAGYLLITALILMAAGFFMMKHLPSSEGGQDSVLNLLPQINPQDKLQFLENYFEGNAAEYVRAYLSVNSDIQILKDYSAGSNATTMLCMTSDRTFFRKYVVGTEADRLMEQISWIERYRESTSLPLPAVLSKKFEKGEMCCYDMQYSAEATGLFNYIHSNPVEDSWNVIVRALGQLQKDIYSRGVNGVPEVVSHTHVENYVNLKVNANIDRILSSHELQDILKYDELIINGRGVKNLKKLRKYLLPSHLDDIFANDPAADIHGDLTVENIICIPHSELYPDGYYLIDPNPYSGAESVYIDYAKLLQSLHGGYEFLMNTQKVTVNGNTVTFLFTRSEAYSALFERYRLYLEERFDGSALKSIYYHEIVNWLRLMPYKIIKNGHRAVLFYAGFIMALNDVTEWFEKEGYDEKQTGDI